MKRSILIIVSLCCSLLAAAQKIYFTDTSNKWKVVFAFVGDATPELTYYEYAYTGDTVIGSNEYHYLEDVGFVREDTIARKVFLLDATTDTDMVFMDYNLEIGDSIRNDTFTHIVTGIDSTLINGYWYKVWNFVSTAPVSWSYQVVEGIGCVEKPSFILYPVELESYWDVYCFSNDGTTPPLSPAIAVLDNVTSCGLASGVKNVHPIATSVYPNPATTFVNVATPGIIDQVTITNMLGQTVYAHKYNTSEIEIDVADFPSGIYFMKINETVVKKFLKD